MDNVGVSEHQDNLTHARVLFHTVFMFSRTALSRTPLYLGAIILGAVSLLVSFGATAEDAAFFSSVNDVPLMDGFYEDSANGFAFDKPSGRVIEATSIGKRVESRAVLAYYDSALPQFGWQTQAQNTAHSTLQNTPKTFVRGAEKMDIAVTHDAAHTYVSIKIAPR